MLRVSCLSGAPPPHTDNAPGRGEATIFGKVRNYSGRRFGGLSVEEQSFVRVGMEASQSDDCSAQSTQEDFTNALQPIPPSSTLWASRPQEVRTLRREQGQLRLLAWPNWLASPNVIGIKAGYVRPLGPTGGTSELSLEKRH